MSGLEVLAVIGIIGFIIYQQLSGQALRGKRVVLLPVILTVIGFTDLHGTGKQHLQTADIICLTIGAAGSIAVGLGFGAITKLESRNGALWARMPVRGLWLWAALIGWRVVIMVLATSMHAHVAASTTTLLFTLGLNRLAQAAVIMPRAMAAGIPFAPEKDGKTFLASAFDRGNGNPSQGGGLPQQDRLRTGQRDQRPQEWVNPLWDRDERPYHERPYHEQPYDERRYSDREDDGRSYDERRYDDRSRDGRSRDGRSGGGHSHHDDHDARRRARRDDRRDRRDDRWDRR